MRARISIKGLLAVVLASGLAFAVLRSANELWASVAFFLAMLTLAMAILGIAFLRHAQRAFCAGYFTFGMGYLVMLGLSLFLVPLPTTKLLDLLYANVPAVPSELDITPFGPAAPGVPGDMPPPLPAPEAIAKAPPPVPGAVAIGTGPASNNRKTEWKLVGSSSSYTWRLFRYNPGGTEPLHFQVVGHALAGCLLAGLGGWLAQLLYEHSHELQAET